jgi:hypothetical protein
MIDFLQMAQLMRDGALGRGAEGGPPASKANIEQAWLRELERAQWERQTRAGVSKSAPESENRHDNVAGRPDAPGRSKALVPAEVRSADARPRPPAPHAGESTPRGAGAGSARFAPKDSAQALAVQPGPRTAPAPQRAAALEGAIEILLRGETRRWDRRKVLVFEQDGRVRVWIRDAELLGPGLRDILGGIVKLIGDAALELEGLTINGCAVFGSQCATDAGANADAGST